jgi:hypothetical protein
VKVEIYDDNTVKIRFQSGTATTVVAPSTTTTTDVARRMQPETEDTPTTSTPIIQQAARFQNASLLVDAIKAPPINENAFKYSAKASNNAAPRSKVAERQAKSRALKKYISCVQSLGSEEQQALIMRDASVRPEIRVPSKAAGFNDARASLAIDHQVQQKKMLSRALATPQKQGRAPDDNRSFAESLLVAIAPSPERVRDVQKTSQRAKIESLGLSYTTGRRLLKSAAKKRKRLTEKEEGALWSFVKRRKGHSKVGPELRKELLEWIMNHENVIASPIAKDTLLVLNKETGEKERVGKLLLEISVRELHNWLVGPVEDGGLASARDANGKVLISDTALRYLLPPQLRKMTPGHKQMCGCEICIVAKSLQGSLNMWRHREVKKRDSIRYTRLVERDGKPCHATPRDALSSIMCPVHPELGLPYWRCVLRRCRACPKYTVPDEEKGTSDTASTINFHVYVPTTSCTKHGVLATGTEIKVCERCQVLRDAEGNNEKLGKVSCRKLLSLLCKPIGTFIEDLYLPALEKYAYHVPHVQILGKNYCGELRQERFRRNPGWVKTKRDYAERLSAKFNMEIQSDHFGNGRSLSIEGSSVEFFSWEDVERYVASFENPQEVLEGLEAGIGMEFHSHFSDKSRQDAATTSAHMTVLMNRLFADGVLSKTERC